MSQDQTKMNAAEVRISVIEMQQTFEGILKGVGFNEDKAHTLADVFAQTSLDGVYTHGVNRFPRFVQYVKDGHVLVDKEPVLVSKAGALEQWNGQSASGILNALFCTQRATDLAKEHSIGCVAISRTNHWMRGGTYGWEAARKGFAFICWTNTTGIMPAWGAKDARVGNNPLIFAMPFNDEAIVLDMAMSQFSFGKMELAQMKGEALPVNGGYDAEGKLTTDPAAILETKRSLPIGFWKGAGLSLLLDIFASILSAGLATNDVSKLPAEKDLSQVFIAIDLSKLHNHAAIGFSLQQIIEDYKNSMLVEGEREVRYPGENVVRIRTENLAKGIPVNQKVWAEILSLL